jgi:hypothetical protein
MNAEGLICRSISLPRFLDMQASSSIVDNLWRGKLGLNMDGGPGRARGGRPVPPSLLGRWPNLTPSGTTKFLFAPLIEAALWLIKIRTQRKEYLQWGWVKEWLHQVLCLLSKRRSRSSSSVWKYTNVYIYIPLRKSVRKEVNYLSISLLSLRSGGSSRSSTRMKAGASTH